jgi:hypothetical protein
MTTIPQTTPEVANPGMISNCLSGTANAIKAIGSMGYRAVAWICSSLYTVGAAIASGLYTAGAYIASALYTGGAALLRGLLFCLTKVYEFGRWAIAGIGSGIVALYNMSANGLGAVKDVAVANPGVACCILGSGAVIGIVASYFLCSGKSEKKEIELTK